MEKLLGWIFLSTILVIILVCTKKHPYIKKVLLIGFFLRSMLVIFDTYEATFLPDSYGDSWFFYTQAIVYSRDYGLSIIFDFFIVDAMLISKIVSIFFTIFGESKMVGQSISVALGTASIYLVYYLCLIVWDHHSAIKAAWVTALFPTLVLYSSFILRETYVVFFLLISLIGIVKFIKKKTFFSLLQVLVSFWILNFFHGPVVLGGFVFLAFLISSLIKNFLIKLYNFRINIFSLLFILVLTLPVSLSFTEYFEVSYLPNLLDTASIITKANYGFTDLASYPAYLYIDNDFELFTKSIIKFFYFLYGPFVWDLKSLFHIVGLFDAMLYFILTIYVFKNWQTIWTNPITRILFLIFIFYVFIYGLGVGNFGTAVRHRSKFVVILIVLAAPMLHKLIFSVKKKLYKK